MRSDLRPEGDAPATEADVWRATVNILEDVDGERRGLHSSHAATLNILEDLVAERTGLESMQRAVLNILEDFDGERAKLAEAQRAVLNILEDLNDEKLRAESHAREATASEEEFRVDFLEFAPEAIVIIDPDGLIVLVNAQVESLFGYDRDDLIGRPLEMLLPNRFREAHAGHRTGYLADPEARAMGPGLDVFGLRRDGREFPADVSLSPLRTRGRVLLAAAVRDVTERKRLEAVREEFIRNAAHELRTPLATLATLGETLALHLHEMSQEQVEKSLAALKRQGERASVLVSNLLDLSQLEGGRMSLVVRATNVSEVVARALESAPPPQGRSVQTSIAPSCSVHADPMRLEQVIGNLLTNAYRYGGPHVRIEAMPAGHDILVSVSDDGAGAPADLIPELFDPFTRGRSAGVVGGSGVGLALCRRIAEAFGGAIWYETARPHGAKLVVRLRRPS